jgi:hypothetical protein
MDQRWAEQYGQMFGMNQKALSEARGFHDRILRQHTDNDTIWFVNVVTALLRGLILECEQLNAGYEKSVRTMAWACRNLMEISVYTEYGLRSEENARELLDDMLMDELEILSSFKKWFTALEPALPTPELDAVVKTFQDMKTDVGIKRKSHRTTRELARILNREPDYEHANKVSSKLIHPTAWSLLSQDLEKDDVLMRPYICQAGWKYFAESFLLIRKHVAHYGTKPVPQAI